MQAKHVLIIETKLPLRLNQTVNGQYLQWQESFETSDAESQFCSGRVVKGIQPQALRQPHPNHFCHTYTHSSSVTDQ